MHPLHLSELNCTGHEVNIGMCKGYYDVYNCTTDAVSIDCSGKHNTSNSTNRQTFRVNIQNQLQFINFKKTTWGQQQINSR